MQFVIHDMLNRLCILETLSVPKRFALYRGDSLTSFYIITGLVLFRG